MNKLRMTTWVLTMSLGAGVFGSTGTAAKGEIEVRLWAQATATESPVRLEQIATVTGDPALVPAIRGQAVTSDLKMARKVQIRAWQVAEQLGLAGFDVSRIRIAGAGKCDVTIVPADTRKPAAATTRPATDRSAAPASLEARLRELIHQGLDARGLPKDHQIEIDFNPTLRDLLALTSPPYAFDITPPRATTWIGLVSFRVRVYRDGQTLQTVPVLAQVRVRIPVVVAARTVNAKARVGRTDVEVSWREMATLNGKHLVNVNDALDQQAKKMIPAGTILTTTLLEPLPLVKRGQLVTVIYRRGGLDIKTVARSMQVGFKNEVIQVRNERSKELFRAKVTSASQVVVEGNLVDGDPGDSGSSGRDKS